MGKHDKQFEVKEKEVEVEAVEVESKEDLKAKIALLEAKVKAGEVEKAQRSEGVFGETKGFIIAKVEPTHPMHIKHWDKGSIFEAQKINMGDDMAALITFTAKLGSESAKYRMNDTVKAFKRLFAWCETRAEAEELTKELLKRKI